MTIGAGKAKDRIIAAKCMNNVIATRTGQLVTIDAAIKRPAGLTDSDNGFTWPVDREKGAETVDFNVKIITIGKISSYYKVQIETIVPMSQRNAFLPRAGDISDRITPSVAAVISNDSS
jgi:hypothetical protein